MMIIELVTKVTKATAQVTKATAQIMFIKFIFV